MIHLSIPYIHFSTDNDIWSDAVYTGPDPKAFENSLCSFQLALGWVPNLYYTGSLFQT